jgi:hypothetical protein
MLTSCFETFLATEKGSTDPQSMMDKVRRALCESTIHTCYKLDTPDEMEDSRWGIYHFGISQWCSSRTETQNLAYRRGGLKNV